MIDATQPFEKQDLTIADLIAREGRAIVFAVNKFDLLPNPAGAISNLVEMRDRLLPLVGLNRLLQLGAAIVPRMMTEVAHADTGIDGLPRVRQRALIWSSTP